MLKDGEAINMDCKQRFKLKFLRCANRGVAPLRYISAISVFVWIRAQAHLGEGRHTWGGGRCPSRLDRVHGLANGLSAGCLLGASG